MDSNTRITETEPDDKIVVSKFAFTCDGFDETIPKPLPIYK